MSIKILEDCSWVSLLVYNLGMRPDGPIPDWLVKEICVASASSVIDQISFRPQLSSLGTAPSSDTGEFLSGEADSHLCGLHLCPSASSRGGLGRQGEPM